MARKSTKNKSEEIQLTQEEINLKEEKRVRESNKYLSEPTYRFNVGDEVLCGNHSNVKIVEVKDGGKFHLYSYLFYYRIKSFIVFSIHMRIFYNFIFLKVIENRKIIEDFYILHTNIMQLNNKNLKKLNT